MSTKQTAHDAYTDRSASVQAKIAALQAKVEAHAMREATDRANWGHAGDLAHVEAKLDELLAFLSA